MLLSVLVTIAELTVSAVSAAAARAVCSVTEHRTPTVGTVCTRCGEPIS